MFSQLYIYYLVFYHYPMESEHLPSESMDWIEYPVKCGAELCSMYSSTCRALMTACVPCVTGSNVWTGLIGLRMHSACMAPVQHWKQLCRIDDSMHSVKRMYNKIGQSMYWKLHPVESVLQHMFYAQRLHSTCTQDSMYQQRQIPYSSCNMYRKAT